MIVPSRIQRAWLNIEPLSQGLGGYNLYLTKIEREDRGPKVGWISHYAAILWPDHLVGEWFSRLYNRWYIEIVDRGYKDLARKIMKRDS